MNKIPNRQAICDVLLEKAKTDKDIVVLCSDSRGSASLAPFFKEFPEQSVEVGIAEQDLVGIAAGLAARSPSQLPLPASCPPGAMSSARWTAPTPIPMSSSSASPAVSAMALLA